jgi:hypothetical protein
MRNRSLRIAAPAVRASDSNPRSRQGASVCGAFGSKRAHRGAQEVPNPYSRVGQSSVRPGGFSPLGGCVLADSGHCLCDGRTGTHRDHLNQLCLLCATGMALRLTWGYVPYRHTRSPVIAGSADGVVSLGVAVLRSMARARKTQGARLALARFGVRLASHPRAHSICGRGVTVAPKWVTARAFNDRLGWAHGTAFRKLHKSRAKIQAHLGDPPNPCPTCTTKGVSHVLTPDDMPIPEDDTRGAPRWLQSTLDRYAESYSIRHPPRNRPEQPPTSSHSAPPTTSSRPGMIQQPFRPADRRQGR